MAASSFRAHSVMVGIFVVIAGLMLGAGAIALHVVGGMAPKAAPIVWIWIGGGVVFVPLDVSMLGVALGRNARPSCPHCRKPVEVNVETWSGKLTLNR